MSFNPYDQHYKEALDPNTREAYWLRHAQKVSWFRQPTKILNQVPPNHSLWFEDGILNMCYNCVDRHLNDCGSSLALIYESPVTKKSRTYTFTELYYHVAKLAGLMKSFGVGKGDRVIIYMPMIPEAIFSMLACARLGAIHSVVFGGFAAKELSGRIKDAEPKLIMTASCGLEVNKIIDYKGMLDESLKILDYQNVKVVIVQREMKVANNIVPGRDYEYHKVIDSAPTADCEPVHGTHPLYILYTSGTTAAPKGIVRDTGGTAVALTWSMHHMFDIQKKDKYFSTSDIGWVVGHSFIVYGPLLQGATTVVFEGKPVGTPDPGIIWRIVEKYKIKGIYTAPTALRVLRKDDPNGDWIRKSDLSSLRHIAMAGERLDIPTYNWISNQLPKCLINDTYWQTESGLIICCNYLQLHTFKPKAGSCTRPVPGFDVRIMGEDNKLITEPYKLGKIVLKLPTPPSFMLTLWGHNEAFIEKYLKEFPGYYAAGDAGYFDEEGFLYVMSRIDDIINTAGHRLSTSAMEEALLTHPDLVEAAVVPVKDEIKGEVPIAFVVLKTGKSHDPKSLEKVLIELIRKEIGAVASLKNIILVPKLPKTRSGKILRAVLRKLINRIDYLIPPTIEDLNVLPEIEGAVKKYGFHYTGKAITSKL